MRLILFVTTTYLLATFSYAQLSGCDAVDCPTDQNGKSQCVLGNATAAALGVLSFNTSLSRQPLTWTLIVQSLNSQENLYERDFFLGSPPSLNLVQNTTTRSTPYQQTQACSLFFEGIASQLRFPGSNPLYDQGTCNDALNAACVADLQAQAKSELSKILHDSSSGDTGGSKGNSNSTTLASSVCETLSTALRANAPTSCTLASGAYWGSILSRPLTSPQSPKPVQPGLCHPTTGGADYELTLIAADQTNALSHNSTDIEDVVYGVTPIMTIVYGGGNGTDDPNAEIDLSCLKAIESNGSSRNSTSRKDSGTVGKGEARGTALVTVAGLACLSLLFL